MHISERIELTLNLISIAVERPSIGTKDTKKRTLLRLPVLLVQCR